MFDPNVIASSILDAISFAVDFIPGWLWVMIILIGVLRVTTRKKSRGGR